MEQFDRRIHSGETFLYREEGIESQIFEIRLKEKVIDSHVATACRRAFKRYPYLNSRLRLHDDGHYYLDKNLTMPIPQRRKKLRPLGSVATQWSIVDITFYGHSIYVAFHHGMCDGMGIMPFIKTLIYYYFVDRYPKKEFSVPDLRREKDPFLPGETADPAVEGNFSFDRDKVFAIDGRTAFRLPEVEGEGTDYCRWEISFDEEAFVNKGKENGCSPVVFASVMMQKAILSVNPDADKPIMSNVVCDWRKALEVPNTFRNCVSCVYLPFSKEDLGTPVNEIGSRDKELLSKQRELDSARANASVIKWVSDKLESLPNQEAREGMMKMMSGHVVDSFTMSYLGKANLGDLEDYLDSIHIYTSGDKGLTIEMMAVDGKMILDLKQSFGKEDYVNALIGEFKKLGLEPLALSPRIDFEVPKDTTRKLGFFKRCGNWLIHRFSKSK